jgi:23S rRNA pseudouridine2605 synthase
MELDDELVARVLEGAEMTPSPRRHTRGVQDKHTRKPRMR